MTKYLEHQTFGFILAVSWDIDVGSIVHAN